MRVLFVGPHTDDEISTAGTLAKFKERGYDIYLVIFSFCEESSEALGYPKDVLKKEFACSIDTLQIKPDHVFTYDYHVRHFPQFRQPILEDLVKLKKEIKPHLVFMPHTEDMHQDHHTISEECIRAFPESSLLGYESPRKLLSMNHICYVRLGCRHMKIKTDCLHCYASQTVRPGMTESIREALAGLRGAQTKYIYAEAFETIRLHL